MGWLPGRMESPASIIRLRKWAVFSSSRSRSSVLPVRRSNIAMDAPTMGGASVLEKRYGLDFWRRTSITSARPVVYPPVAPPSAFPRVLLMMSTSPWTPHSSSVPRPVGPRNPVAWHSSTNTSASCFLARRQISLSGAMSPSIENTPSVAIRRVLAEAASFSFASRSAMSRWLYLYREALHSRMPSIMDAWLSASDITASSEVRIASNSPAFASKQEGYKIVSEVP
mmetsp:Transcript_25080/g.59765  ORF Transcript_25080/g.59765 Transcript_25080/m.59765 type:complete len:226 (-) Transcript_25080:512-1189(-)